MGVSKHTKTFGMRVPTDLYEKLLFDIERLRSASSSAESKFAAFDCAVDAWHLVDWTLHSAGDDQHKQLTGRTRLGTPKDRNLTVEGSFAVRQEKRLPALRFYHMIANSVKHREVRNDLMPSLWSGSTATFSFAESESAGGQRSVRKVSLLTYIEYDSQRFQAIELFEDMADQWRAFLIEEGLFEFRPEYPGEE